MKLKSNPIRILAVALGLIGLAELAVGFLYFSMNNAAYFNLQVYAGMTEEEVLAVTGTPIKILQQGEEEALKNLQHSYYPHPDLPIENKVFIYTSYIHQYRVYFDRDKRVKCVTTGRT